MTDIQDGIKLSRKPGDPPVYRQIATAIATRVDEGRIGYGERLPPLRDLAARLGVNVATVARSYRVLEKRGLVESTRGRGTFVRRNIEERLTPETGRTLTSSFIDLTINRAATSHYTEALSEALPQMAKDTRLAQLRDYTPPEGLAAARDAGATWINQSRLDVAATDVVVTSGAQHALLLCLAAIVQPGDVILSSELTYYGLRAIGRLLRFSIEPVPTDASGLVPEALAERCRDPHVRAIFVVPCMHNPTAVTIPEERRRQLADIARSTDTFLIEDDVYGPLLSKRPLPLASMHREGTFYITGTSKSMAPGLRVGFLSPPRSHLNSVIENVCATEWMPQPLMTLIFANWMRDGTARAIVEHQRATLATRFDLAQRILDGEDYAGEPGCPHIWLRLPPPWRAQEFVNTAENNGVGVLPAEAFMIGRSEAPHAVRINLGAATSEQALEEGLNRLMNTLNRCSRSAYRLA